MRPLGPVAAARVGREAEPVPAPRLGREADPAPAPGAQARIGHNGGPPLDHVPAWGKGGFGTFFHWRAARKRAFTAPSRDVAMLRLRNAERIGLTCEEYTLELLERGRHLGPDDVEAIAAVKARRKG